MDSNSLQQCLDLLRRADELLMVDARDRLHAARLAMVIDGLTAEYNEVNAPPAIPSELE